MLASAVRGRPLRGELESDDLDVVVKFAGGSLVGAIDGLGHGEEAAAAARAAATICREHADDPLGELVQRCHTELRRTRGAVLRLASFRDTDATMSWLGVGNVEGVLIRADADAERPQEELVCRPEIDGRFCVVASPTQREPGDLADDILRGYTKEIDDTLVVVACYRDIGR
jgi:negative regulator of sigma-B (phosphoserine phosphatase)